MKKVFRAQVRTSSWVLSRTVFQLVVGTALLFSNQLVADSAQQLYANYQNRIYQIVLVDLSSGSKSTIGSGFQVSEDGLVATNYHVVANTIYHPQNYRIEWIDFQGKVGELTLVSVNVVHDLALLRHAEAERKDHLQLATVALEQGQSVYSIGNPRDLGMTVVPGTYNGLLEHRFYERILFSGSLNPGMSGGPALNAEGEVIGVNVATAGNQISFLVPVSDLQVMLQQLGSNDQPFMAQITEQLMDNQARQIGQLMANPWAKIAMGDATVVGELAGFTRCWGGASEESKSYERFYSTCFSEDNIYLAADFTTGILNYEFYWIETDTLTPWQFYSRFQNEFVGAMAVNHASKNHVGNFKCHNEFVITENASEQVWKSVLCVRPYKNFKGLFDVLFIAATTQAYDRGLVSHFVLSGVSEASGLAFTERFMREIKGNR